jgi:hypothetical protein
MKNIKPLTLIFALLTISSIFAQNERFKEKMDQVKSLKVAFITNELALTADESAKFWPVYNAFETKQREIRKQKISSYMDRRDDAGLEKLTEKEASGLLSQMESNEEQLHQLRKKLVSDLRGILPAVKIIKLKKAEEDFNKKLLEQYRNKRRK